MEYKQLKGFSKYKIFEDGSVEGPSGKILKLEINNNYYRLEFRADDGSSKNLMIHRVMAHLYYGLELNNYDFEPDHKDRNKLNNHKNNIEIVTKSENCRRRSGREPNSCMDTSEFKQCSKCGLLKDRKGYKKSSGSADGLGSWCHECTKEYKKAYSRQRGWTKQIV